MDWHHIIIVFLIVLLTQCNNHVVRGVITDVRLVGGPTPDRGTVEIRQDNERWETTCGVNLDINDVIVICRQLGFTGASRVIKVTPYAQNSTPTVGIGCNGAEVDLTACMMNSFSCESMTAGAASCHDQGYLGCFVGSAGIRALTGDSLLDDSSMNIKKCIKFCDESASENYTYAGVGFGEECYCGKASDQYARHGVGLDSDCQYKCAGDPTESCGGSGFIAVFTISTATPTTTTATIMSTASTPELSSNNQDMKTDYRSTAATSAPSTTSMTMSALPLTGTNTGLYRGIGGGVAAFIIIVIIIVILFIMGRRSQKGRKDPTSSQRMSSATASMPSGANGLGISNAAVEETSAAGGSQHGLHASNTAAASVPTASGGDKTGLLVNLNPNKSMNIYGGIDDEVLGDGMMPYASSDTAATVQNNNGRLSVVYAMPDKNGNEPRNDYEVITNEMAPFASVDNVNPMRPRTMPNKTDRLSVVYAASDKNGNGPRNDTSEDFDCLYAMPDKHRGQPDGNDDGIVHGLYAKVDESLSADQFEPDMVENELYTI